MKPASLPVSQLPPHERMTVEECLGFAARNAADWQDVIVVGYDHDGELLIRSSAMNRGEALWLLQAAARDVVEPT